MAKGRRGKPAIRTERISVRVKPALYKELTEMARRDNRTLSSYAEIVLEAHALRNNPKKD